MQTRQGVATVELAVCLPVLSLLVFGTLSATSMIFLRQAVVQSAYETAKAAARSRGSVEDAVEKGRQVLEFRDITATSVVFEPADVSNQVKGTPFTVTVTAAADPSRFFSFGPFAGQSVEVAVTMLKE
jgi:Flp pilus assembly protein TadG